MFQYFYNNIVLKYSNISLILILTICIAFLSQVDKLQIDASANSLLLDNDKDLKFTRDINKKYNNEDILIVAFFPKDDLLSKKSLDTISKLTAQLKKLKSVKSTTSILNVPLLQSPLVSIGSLINQPKTLSNTKKFNQSLVKKEFILSPLYKNSLVSKDFKSTAIIIYLNKELSNNKDAIHKTIQDIRSIIKPFKNDASIFLGGISMISDDIITFVKNDLLVYGISLLIILSLVLFIIFKKFIWIAVPLFICLLSVGVTAGAISIFQWDITVISSNFVAMELIITLAIVIHLIVRYNELNQKYPKTSQKRLILNTMLSKINPTFFAVITTVAGFMSLIFSGIKPIANLGYIMSMGITISFLISFTLFPLILFKIKKLKYKKIDKKNNYFSITKYTANIVKNNPRNIYIYTAIIVIVSLIGASKLIVENSFISYFKQNTEIYKGMKVIDTKLGGTTPLDIIVTFNTKPSIKNDKSQNDNDEFDDEFSENANDDNDYYWFTNDKLDKILKVHKYLESIEYIGDVKSLATLLDMGKILNSNKYLTPFELGVLYKKIPENYRRSILNPYLNIKDNQVRFATRVIDSNPNLRRDNLIKKIQNDLNNLLKDDKVRLANIMILYNNMLQSLFQSQIKTLGFVVLILFLMFVILFRSIKISALAIIANIIPIMFVFSIMGYMGIPLDIITITIAAISIGIGIDNTIHYIHRFKKEYSIDKNYLDSMKRTHLSLGNAMAYTSITIMFGFLVLVLSNLVPTIYFGLLTVLVMLTILLSSLILLPRLLVNFRVFS